MLPDAGAQSVTRALLIKWLEEDLKDLGFKRHDNKKLILKSQDITVELNVDVIHVAMNPNQLTKQVNLDFYVSLLDAPIDPDPRGVKGLWAGVGWLDRYHVFEQTGPREPYLFAPGDTYENSRLRKDMQDYGFGLLASFRDKTVFLDYLLCRAVVVNGHQITRSPERSRNELALSLYFADRMHDRVRAAESIDKLKIYVAFSKENHENTQRLLSVKGDIADLVRKYDNNFYERLSS
jgi:hypothetical protein